MASRRAPLRAAMPRALRAAMLSTSLVLRAGRRDPYFRAECRFGCGFQAAQAVEEWLRSSPPAGSSPRYSGRFLIPSRADHFE
jgi:hypothetical protein